MTQLTDRSALLSHRARCLRAGPEDFLHRIAIEELQDRLSMVNKTFTDMAVVGGWMPCLASSACASEPRAAVAHTRRVKIRRQVRASMSFSVAGRSGMALASLR